MKNKLGLVVGLVAGATAVLDFIPPHLIVLGIVASILTLVILFNFLQENKFFRRKKK